MTLYWFPDNTVLCNFAAVHRVQLLEAVLDGRGRWVEAVAQEATASSHYLPDLTKLHSNGTLGEPIEITDLTDISLIERTRRSALGGLASEPRKHLGEAQTCHVIAHWSEYSGSFWISDDQDALEYALIKGITSRETKDLISEAIVSGLIGRSDAYQLLTEMRGLGRHLSVPASSALL